MMMLLRFKLIFVFCVLGLLTACSEQNEIVRAEEVLLQGRTMGTTYNIKLVVKRSEVDIDVIHQQINILLKQVNQEMSTYIDDSELSLFNQSRSVGPTVISLGFKRVMSEAIRLGQLTDGKLDVTIGPLVNLWGFGPEFKPETVPSNDDILAAKARVGINKLSIKNNLLTKKKADISVDLSTIAKGYGVDVIAQYIESKNIENYLVEIGGEMRLSGFKHNGTLWHVAIEKPMTEQRSVYEIIVPKNNAVATSGDYRNYYEVNGQHFSHIIDPHSGKPIDHRLVSVTVIHPSSMTADGLSTALMVMGFDEGMKFAQQHDIAALFIAKTDDGFEQQNTVKFSQFLK